jgi:hypothetical protein
MLSARKYVHPRRLLSNLPKTSQTRAADSADGDRVSQWKPLRGKSKPRPLLTVAESRPNRTDAIPGSHRPSHSDFSSAPRSASSPSTLPSSLTTPLRLTSSSTTISTRRPTTATQNSPKSARRPLSASFSGHTRGTIESTTAPRRPQTTSRTPRSKASVRSERTTGRRSAARSPSCGISSSEHSASHPPGIGCEP